MGTLSLGRFGMFYSVTLNFFWHIYLTQEYTYPRLRKEQYKQTEKAQLSKGYALSFVTSTYCFCQFGQRVQPNTAPRMCFTIFSSLFTTHSFQIETHLFLILEISGLQMGSTSHLILWSLLIPMLFKKEDQFVFYWSRDRVEFLAGGYLIIYFLDNATFYTMGDLGP